MCISSAKSKLSRLVLIYKKKTSTFCLNVSSNHHQVPVNLHPEFTNQGILVVRPSSLLLRRFPLYSLSFIKLNKKHFDRPQVQRDLQRPRLPQRLRGDKVEQAQGDSRLMWSKGNQLPRDAAIKQNPASSRFQMTVRAQENTENCLSDPCALGVRPLGRNVYPLSIHWQCFLCHFSV